MEPESAFRDYVARNRNIKLQAGGDYLKIYGKGTEILRCLDTYKFTVFAPDSTATSTTHHASLIVPTQLILRVNWYYATAKGLADIGKGAAKRGGKKLANAATGGIGEAAAATMSALRGAYKVATGTIDFDCLKNPEQFPWCLTIGLPGGDLDDDDIDTMAETDSRQWGNGEIQRTAQLSSPRLNKQLKTDFQGAIRTYQSSINKLLNHAGGEEAAPLLNAGEIDFDSQGPILEEHEEPKKGMLRRAWNSLWGKKRKKDYERLES